MPKTPQVNFSVQNNNVEVNTPLLGITHVLARTTKGPFEDPSTIINSYPQFQRIFGEEMVPDGSISNIEKAFSMGSRLRVSRVKGSGSIAYGESAKDLTLTLKVSDTTMAIPIKIRTREQGTAIVDPESFNKNASFDLSFDNENGLTRKFYLIQSSTDESDNVTTISKDVMFSWSGTISSNTLSGTFDPSVFRAFVETVPNLYFYIDPADQTVQGVTSIEDVIDLIGKASEIAIAFEGDTTTTITEGTNGGDTSTQVNWEAAFDAIKGYDDGYQLIASHIHQHLVSAYTSVYKTIRDFIHGKYGIILYVEVPKTFTTKSTIIAQLGTMIYAIGHSKNVAYFAGGLKYYNKNGILKDCDVLGTVVGLGDSSATAFGPWYSFSGMNRGVVPYAYGPVMENLGGPNSISDLQDIADWNCNLFVVKNTRTTGLRTMLWHGFTSTGLSDSEKFLATERLLLYMKKNLTPILESYLEEPNTFSNWMNIYLEGKQIMDDLVDRNAIERYKWDGDQDKTSFDDLQVNDEADVRQGKYRILLHMREIVPLQDISFEVTIDKANANITVGIVE